MKKHLYTDNSMTYKNKYFNTNTQLCYGLSVLEYGWQQSGPKHSYGPSVRRHFVLHYIKEGSGTYIADGKRFLLKKNDVFIIFPDAQTRYEASIKDPWEYWWIGFTGIDAPHLVALTGAVKDCPVFPITDGTRLLTLFETLRLPEDTVYNMNATLFRIFDELSVQSERKKTQRNLNYVLERAFEIIENKKALLTVEELSDMVGISRSHLFKIFQKTLDMSPQRYIMMHRLHAGMELLKYSVLPVYQIAEDTGFCDVSHFSREMKKHFNTTPTEYRKSAKNINGTIGALSITEKSVYSQ